MYKYDDDYYSFGDFLFSIGLMGSIVILIAVIAAVSNATEPNPSESLPTGMVTIVSIEGNYVTVKNPKSTSGFKGYTITDANNLLHVGDTVNLYLAPYNYGFVPTNKIVYIEKETTPTNCSTETTDTDTITTCTIITPTYLTGDK